MFNLERIINIVNENSVNNLSSLSKLLKSNGNIFSFFKLLNNYLKDV